MINQSVNNFTISPKQVYGLFVFLIGLSIAAVYYTESFVPLLLPMCIISTGFLLDDFRRLFYLIFIVLPFSVEHYFEAVGLGLDIPSEPLMAILMGITLLILIRDKFSFPKVYLFHPITLLLFLHVFWIFITSINSTFPVLSFKFFIAKFWYILPFFVFPIYVFKESNYLIKAYKILFYFLFLVICIVLVRHAFEGFTFAASYNVVRPFFRNHVNYAAMSVIVLPFVWAFLKMNKTDGRPYLILVLAFIIFVVGIYFSFTRAAILSMFIAWGAYYIFEYKLVKHSLLATSIVLVIGMSYLAWDNKYMDFAPDFEKTITHTEFDNLIEATYKLEDISSMERVYRWMAGAEMIKEKFWLGFGPSTFYSNYKSYSISSFQTYVSDNPEKSGIHSYFLMTWVEQGIVGLIIFISLCFVILVYGQNVYHAATDPKDKYFIMGALLSLIIILAMNLINDLIETDKVGPFFFFNTAIILFYFGKYRTEMNLDDV